MKKLFNVKIIVIFIIGFIIFGSIGIYGANVYHSNSIEYSPTDSSWNVSNVEEAINDLNRIVNNNISNFTGNIITVGLFSSNQTVSVKEIVSNWNELTVDNFKILSPITSGVNGTGGNSSSSVMISRAQYRQGSLSYDNTTGQLTVNVPTIWHSYWFYKENKSYYESTFNTTVAVVCNPSSTNLTTIGTYSSNQTVNIKDKVSNWNELTVDNFRILQPTTSGINGTGGNSSSSVMVSRAQFKKGSLSYNNTTGDLTITVPTVWHSYWFYNENKSYYESTFNMSVTVVCGDFIKIYNIY